ncbi:type IIL restriction-modification enzyme MmeI [Psychromicrobium lacuslunae]|uniref:type IIL restriction-modification enzyme MmeI n=1 Tax=Psychromicrobium lacuslunae TaxID=1618207 RepID=UPI0012FEA5B1|nr:type IIL restriction-modification enzyme MmeI [Psychromicrobium lacuslunae]
MIATNTVAQGDSREVGLDSMVSDGFTITRAVQSRSWPASSANLEYAAVWGTREVVEEDVPRIADDIAVRRISTLLEPAGRVDGMPARLAENSGLAFIGCYVLGMGFVLEPEEAQEWIASDTRNAEVLFPYLNGEDLNQRPDSSASRWVIDFNDRTEEQAATYKLPYHRLVERVKPERQRRKSNGEYALRKPLPERWWQYGEKRPAMRKAIADLSEVLVIALVSKSVMPLRVSTNQVFSHRLGVYATDSFADQAVLSSSLHWLWAITYSSTLETRVNYSPSDAFLTFPLPQRTERLEAAGRALENGQRELMARRGIGLTDVYNLVADPAVTGAEDVGHLRNLHVEVDAAVLEAFGWRGIELDHSFYTVRKMQRWTVGASNRVELLDLLLEENHRRMQNQLAPASTLSGTADAEAMPLG